MAASVSGARIRGVRVESCGKLGSSSNATAVLSSTSKLNANAGPSRARSSCAACGSHGFAAAARRSDAVCIDLREFAAEKGRRRRRCSYAQARGIVSGSSESDVVTSRLGVNDGRHGSRGGSIFDVVDPRTVRPSQWDVAHAWEVLRADMLYLDYRARQDVLAIKCAHDKVVEALNPTAREQKSVEGMRSQLEQLQEELKHAHEQVHLSEARVGHSLQRLAEMEALVHDKLLNKAVNLPRTSSTATKAVVVDAERDPQTEQPTRSKLSNKYLDVSGPVKPYPEWLKNFWYPATFSSDLDSSTLIPLECFEEPWVLFRGADGRPGCIRDECAHRACPLSLGTITEGRIQCPYHGWEYSTTGTCEIMPSTRHVEASVHALPCLEYDGMVWIWPGRDTPSSTMPKTSPPNRSFSIHAEIVLELPVEHGLLMENLLDLAHAPFTHTGTFAKGWPVPSMVDFKTAAAAALRGHWDPYPIDMEFRPPCMVLSTIGLAQPGKLQGKNVTDCKQHLFQLHCCMPSSRGKTRLLYRMALDFANWAKHVPFIQKLWTFQANQVLAEDLRLVLGQQDRMQRGANVWNTPVAYDKLGVRYRRWRNAVEAGDEKAPFESDQN